MSASRQNCRQHPVSISFNAAPSNSTDQVHPFVRFPDIILMMPPASSSASSSAATSPEDGCAPRFRDGKIFPLDFPVYDASASGGIIPLDVQDRIQDELRQIFGCASRMRATLICRTRFFSRAMRQSRRTMIFKYVYDLKSGDIFAIDVPGSPLHQRVASAIATKLSSQLHQAAYASAPSGHMWLKGQLREFDVVANRRRRPDPDSQETNIGFGDNVTMCPRVIIEVEHRHRRLNETIADVTALEGHERLRCFVLVRILPRQNDGRFPLYCVMWRRPLVGPQHRLEFFEVVSFGTAPLPQSVLAELRTHFPNVRIRDYALREGDGVPALWDDESMTKSLTSRSSKRNTYLRDDLVHSRVRIVVC